MYDQELKYKKLMESFHFFPPNISEEHSINNIIYTCNDVRQLEPQGVCNNALKLVEDVGKGHSDLHIKPSNRVSHQTLSKLSVNAESTFVSLQKGQHGSF